MAVEEIVAVRTFRSRLPVRRVRHMDIQLLNYSIIESLSASRHRRQFLTRKYLRR